VNEMRGRTLGTVAETWRCNWMSIEPCDHVPVYKRIELRPVRRPEPPEPVNARAERIRSAEADRIWAITKQTAEGCNQPTRRR
jgi:hypothetical protein